MDYSLRDLIDIPQLAKLLDSLDAVQTMPSAIVDMEGNVLTATAWQDVCTKFHRAHPDTERQCRDSDTYFANKLCDQGGHFLYKCPMGLVDTATPIIVEGKHLGNVFTGQLFLEPPDEAAFLDQAQRFGFDQTAYLEAVRKVPLFTEEQLHKNLTFLRQLAEMLANEGLKKKRLIEAEEALREAHQFNDQIIASAKEGIIVYDTDLRYVVWNPFMEYISGMKASQVLGKRPDEVFPFLKDTGVLERLKGALAGEAQEPVDFPYHVPSTGKSGWNTDTSVTFRNAKGEIIGVIGTVSEITERKRAEAKLRETEELFLSLVETTQDGFWVADLQGRLLQVNDAYCHMSGYGRPELLTMSIADLEAVETPTERENHIRAIMLTGADRFETRHRRKDGSTYDVEITAQCKSERAKAIITFVRDITERKQIAEERRYNRICLERAENVARFGNWELDLTSKKMHASAGAISIYGLQGQEWSLETVRSIVTLECKAKMERALNNLIQYNQPYNIEFKVVRPSDGQVRDIHSIAEYDPDKRIVFGVIHDITERKQAELALQESEIRFTKAFQINQDAVFISDTETGHYLEVNEGFVRMTGYTQEEAIGRNSGDLGLWVYRSDRNNFFKILFASGYVRGFVARLRHRDGHEYWGELESDPIDIGGRPCIFTITRDVTGRIEEEKRIRRLNDELEQRVKDRTAQLEEANQELEAFSYSVSHDLRAPLNGIDGFSQALAEDYLDRLDEAGRKYISRIRVGTQRMGQIIDDLLKLSHVSRSELDLVEVDLSDLCQKVLVDLARVNPQQRVDVSIQPGLSVRADHRLLLMVLENLLRNAVKFTSKREEARIEVGGLISPSGEPAFFIRDNGAGFEMRNADKLFDAFQRLHTTDEFEGSGIGLAIVQRIISRHGGRIWAEAEPEMGATFFFTLPDRSET